VKLFHHRFAIETGYRDKNNFFIPPSTDEWRVRLFLFAYAVLLWNRWRVYRWQLQMFRSLRVIIGIS
jgi:hypothetical protein